VILENHLDVPADPDAVFALINDVERVARCLPGAVLEGQEGDAYLGRVAFKVGPIKAAYAGRIRFTEIDAGRRRLRLSARGADSHGNGDAEADVTLSISPAACGAALDLHTDLMVRGKIAQFGKSAITSVSGRLLDQFARNLAEQLQQDPASTSPANNGAPVPNAASGAPATAQASAPPAKAASAASAGGELDGLAMLLPPNAGRWALVGGAVVAAFVQGYLVGRLRGKNELIEELRRGR
jgi:uncharacterized protein